MTCVCTLFSGSSGNGTYIRSGDNEFLVDAGSSARAVTNALNSLNTDIKKITAFFITHEHVDHISALKNLCAAHRIPVIANKNTLNQIILKCGVDPDLCVELPTGRTIGLNNVYVTSFSTSHDSAESVGYKIQTPDGVIGYATDLGKMTKKIIENLNGCKIVVLESNHDVDMLQKGKYPPFLKKRVLSDRGHLSNDICAASILELSKSGTRDFILAHLSHENNKPEIAFETASNKLKASGAIIGQDIFIEIAPRFTVGKLHEA